MNKRFLSVITTLIFVASTLLPTASVFAAGTPPVTEAPPSTYGVTYEAHVQNIGWQNWVSDGQEAGTDGQSLRMEALKLTGTNLPAGASITYEAHVQNIGWQNWVSDGQEAGTDGQSLRMEALKITLNGLPGYEVKYEAHVQNIGWQNWVSDGQEAGTDGQSLRMEALKIEIVKTDAEKAAEVTAINAVTNAETTKTTADVTAATTAIQAVQDTVENSSLTARVAAINVKLEVTSVSAINATTLNVAFSGAVTDTSVITFNVLRGTVPVSLTPTWAADKKSVQLASSVNLLAGTYTVTVGGATFTTNSGSVTVSAQAISSVSIPTNQVIKDVAAKANFTALDQYGTTMTTSTRGDYTWVLANQTDSTRPVTFAGANGDKFLTIDTRLANVGDQILITGILNANPAVKVTKTVTVANIYIGSFQLGQPVLPTGTTILVQNAGYVQIPYTATDNYNNAVTLSLPVIATANAASVQGIQFLTTDPSIIPVADAANNFTVDANGKLQFKVLDKAGTVTLTAVDSNNGTTSSITIKVNANAAPASVQFGQLNQPIVAGDVNGTATLGVTFNDQYGNPVTVAPGYDMSTIFNVSVVPSTGLTVNLALTNGKINFQENVATVGNYTLTLTNKITGAQFTQALTVNSARVPNQLVVATAPAASVVGLGTTQVVFNVLDQYGQKMAAAAGYDVKGTTTSGGATILNVPASTVIANPTSITITGVAAGTDTATFTLEKTVGNVAIDSKSFNIKDVANAASFKVTTDATSYIAGNNITVTVTALDAGGNAYPSYNGSGVATVKVTPTVGAVTNYLRNLQFVNGVATATIPATVADSVGTTIKVSYNAIDYTDVTTPTVAVGAMAKLVVAGLATGTAVTVNATDSCGNTVATYTGNKIVKVTYVNSTGVAKVVTDADADGNVIVNFAAGSGSVQVSALVSGDKVTATVDGFTGTVTIIPIP